MEGDKATIFSSCKYSFVKVFFSDLFHDHLEIPPAFQKHLKGKGPGPFGLLGPSGNLWRVKLVDDDQCIYFGKGWAEFARDHSLQFGDFLVFQYDGRLLFSVAIYDKSACEKIAAFSARKGCDEADGRGEKGERRGGVKKEVVEDSGDEDVKVVAEKEVAAEVQHEKVVDEVVTTTKRKRGRPRKYTETVKGSEKKGAAPDESVPNTPINMRGRRKGKTKLVSRRREVSEQEIQNTHTAAYSFKSRKPCFVVTMRSSNVYNGYILKIPTPFFKQHLQMYNGSMIIHYKGTAWRVSITTFQNGTFIAKGWRKFSLDNNLEEYDACVFEILNAHEMQVHIFRVVEEITPIAHLAVNSKS